MNRAVKLNQQNPPSPKKVRVDSLGNDKRKLLLKKKDGSTTMICAGITENACKIIANRTLTLIQNLGGKLEGTFIIIR